MVYGVARRVEGTKTVRQQPPHKCEEHLNIPRQLTTLNVAQPCQEARVLST